LKPRVSVDADPIARVKVAKKLAKLAERKGGGVGGVGPAIHGEGGRGTYRRKAPTLSVSQREDKKNPHHTQKKRPQQTNPPHPKTPKPPPHKKKTHQQRRHPTIQKKKKEPQHKKPKKKKPKNNSLNISIKEKVIKLNLTKSGLSWKEENEYGS